MVVDDGCRVMLSSERPLCSVDYAGGLAKKKAGRQETCHTGFGPQQQVSVISAPAVAMFWQQSSLLFVQSEKFKNSCQFFGTGIGNLDAALLFVAADGGLRTTVFP